MNNTSLEYPFDPTYILRNKNKIKKELIGEQRNNVASFTSKRIAILGGSTTDYLKDVLELFLLNQGIQPTFYQSEYNSFYEDAIFGNEELDSFNPDVVIIFSSFRNIKQLPNIDNDDSDTLLEAEFSRYKQMWESITRKYQCPIIQNNFERPVHRYFGNKDCVDHRGWSNYVHRLNSKFYDYASTSSNLFINDIDYLAAEFGLSNWHDEQTWFSYKQAMSMNAVPSVAFSVSNIIKSLFGKNKKALILDLDNTLWGGVIGDDGVNNIKIGDETAIGEAYSSFQKTVKHIRSMGIMLCICSKNEEDNAISGLNHPRSILNPSDFTIIKANWDPKNINVENIIKSLNIGSDSIVFVDDNPAEQMIVRQSLPAVSVPNIGSDVSNYSKILVNSGFFEITSLTNDDLNRTKMYEDNIKRDIFQQSFESYTDYLRSLDMVAEFSPFNEIYMQRITQLINKTNQFNLTTLRVTEEEVKMMATSSNYITLYGRLIDKFGDNGLITVFSGELIQDSLHIRIWLMSCRVLKRDVEYKLMEKIVEKCKERGISTIIGYYYPTSKNRMVADLYEKLGFTKDNEDLNGNTVWRISTSKYTKVIEYIREQ